jgi:carboxymethylenebutenolidase
MTTITFPGPDGAPIEGYLARPAGDGPAPGVLLAMDAIGLRPQILEMAERIASWGYVVLAPNLFHRNGTIAELMPTGDLTTPEGREAVFAVVGPMISTLTTELVLADVAAYTAALRALDGVAPGPLGVTGYCMGARLAVRAACALPDEYAAVGGFHAGGLVTDAEDSPHRGLDAARAEFVFGHADQDRSMPAEAVDALGEALRGAGLTATNEIYPGAPHGYTMADTAMYQEAGAERHYRALRELFGRAL